MKLLHLSQARFLLQAPWSTITVLIGIALGVASVTAVHLISLSINNALAAVTPAYLRELTYLVERPDLQMDDYFDLRAAWRRGEHPEITAMVPIVEGQLVLEDQTLTVIGVDAFSGLRSLLMLAALPVRGVLASEAVIRQPGVELESDWTPRPLSPLRPGFQISGLVPGITERLLIADLGTAQDLLQLPPGALSRVGVSVEHPLLALETLLDKLLPGAGAGFAGYQWSLPGWRVRTLDSELPSQAFAQSVLFNLGALGSLALVVSWLLVYQVGLMWLRRRRRTMDMLTLQGVTRAELLRGHLFSLLLLAALATCAGIAAGWGLAALLSRITTAGLGVEVALPALDQWALAKAVCSGLGVSLAGGYLAFRQEWQSRPAAARWMLVLIGCVLLPLAAAGIWLVEALWGGFLAIVALCLAVVLLISPLLGAARSAAREAPGLPILARVGVRELVWYPRALVVAIAALTLAIASSVAVAIMVDSFRADFSRMLELRLSHDVFVRSSGRDVSEVARVLGALPEVTDVVAAGHVMVRVDGLPVELGFSRFDEAQGRRYGITGALAADQALANERLLRLLDVSTGETLRVNGRQLTLVGAFPGFGDALPRLLVDADTAADLAPGLVFDRLSVTTAAAPLVSSLLAARYPQLDVQLAQPLRQLALRIFDQTFAITRALTLLALLVACIGLYNALLGLKLLAQPTLTLLQNMGVSAAELRRIALWRGLAVGAGVMGFALPLGVLMGAILCSVINPRAFGWSLELQLTPAAVMVPVLLGFAVILITSLLPAPGEKLAEAG